MECPKCKEEIPQERIDLGYKTCVKCSTTEKYGYIRISEGKTADSIAIIRDAKLAEKIRRKQNRRHGQI